MLSSSVMDAMERLRRRMNELLDLRTSAGKLRHKRLAEYLNKSEAWLSNILEGRRGLRMVDLDAIAEFFHVPPSELVREFGTELEEVTPSERTLLRRLRRAKQEDRDAIYRFAGLADDYEIRPNVTKKNTQESSQRYKMSRKATSHSGTDRADDVGHRDTSHPIRDDTIDSRAAEQSGYPAPVADKRES